MALWEIVFIALALSIDAFSVSFAFGHCLANLRSILRLAFHFGLFQGMMAMLGWLGGKNLVTIIGAYDHWVAFGLLTLIALRMLIESFRPPEVERKFDPSRGLSLIGLSISVSIDSLGVGVGLGVLKISILMPFILFSLLTLLMSVLGVYLGRVLGSIIGRRIETIGAIILFIIAIKLLEI
ncbi:MAG: manganese efflux pump MntP family protein [Candidatus Sumerlaeia bacterium]|nr:manganese efflux pump MntP family protein [Candidatus Sumerlaeia bacterium]